MHQCCFPRSTQMAQAINHAHITPLLYFCIPLMSICSKICHSRAIVPILLALAYVSASTKPLFYNVSATLHNASTSTTLRLEASGIVNRPIVILLSILGAKHLASFWGVMWTRLKIRTCQVITCWDAVTQSSHPVLQHCSNPC